MTNQDTIIDNDYDQSKASISMKKNRRQYAAGQFELPNQTADHAFPYDINSSGNRNANAADANYQALNTGISTQSGAASGIPGNVAATTGSSVGMATGGVNGSYNYANQQNIVPAGQNLDGYHPRQNRRVLQDMKQLNMNNRSFNELLSCDLVNQIPRIADIDNPPPVVTLPERLSLTDSPTANGPNKHVRCTLNAVPVSHSILKKSKLPFALILRPFTTLHQDDEDVPIIKDQIIARCRRCRAYINSFAIFVEDGQRWRCTLCNLVNDVPQGFDWDVQANQKRDRWSRFELNHSVVDFIAPQEYMVRVPQPLFIVILLDVSSAAFQSGLVATASRAVLESLDGIPNSDGRTRVAFIGIDSSLHFFGIKPETNEPSINVVSDLEEPFLPLSDSILINLQDNRKSIENLLERFCDFFTTMDNGGFALGPALKSAHKLIGGIGGKIISIMASLPNLGDGKLSVRDDSKVWGSSKEASYLQTQNPFYRSFAVECSRSQVTVDFFCLSSQYQDVASLSCLPRYTGGQTHYYHYWSALNAEDAFKFSRDLIEHLSMEVTLEAVMRVRGTSGLRMQSFHGNFFNRSSDLCAFPSFPRDQGYVVEISIDEQISKQVIILQTAVLHSTCHGERRIRVITLALPTTESLSDIFASADQNAIATYFAVKAAEKAMSSGPESARNEVVDRLNGILDVYKKNLVGQNTGASLPLQIALNLDLLPLLCLGLIKHIALRPGNIPSDSRSAALNYLSTFPSQKLIPYILPRFYCLHAMPESAGLPSENGIVLPPLLNLTSQNLEFYGMYLLFDGINQIIWIGKDAIPLLLEDVFGVSSLQEVPAGKTSLTVTDSVLNQKIHNILGKLKNFDKGTVLAPQLWVIRGGIDMALQLWAFSMLIEDRAESQPSYHQFISQLKAKSSNN